MAEKITEEKYWQVYGMFVAARLHQSYVNDMEREIQRLLSLEDQGHLSDLIYDYGPHPDMSAFDEALRREGFERKPPED